MLKVWLRPVPRSVYSGKAGLRRRTDDRRSVWSARHPDRLSVPEMANRSMVSVAAAGRGDPRLLDKVPLREEELKRNKGWCYTQEGNHILTRCRCSKDARSLFAER